MKINLQELVDVGIIDVNKAKEISKYYKVDQSQEGSRLLMIFGVIGACLIGLGIILIVGHNWDSLSQTTKSVLAFVPMLIAQLLCGYTLLRKSESRSWREATAALLIMTIGACIAMISQIYHLEGSMASFMMLWLVLSIPVMFVMDSAMALILYLWGLIQFGFANAFLPPYPEWSWIALIAFGLAYYYWRLRKSTSNFKVVLDWIIPITIALLLWSTVKVVTLSFTAYMALFAAYYLWGERQGERRSLLKDGYRLIGSVGTAALLVGFTFEDAWSNIRSGSVSSHETTMAGLTLILLFAVVGYLLFDNWKKDSSWSKKKMVYLLFIPFSLLVFLDMGDVFSSLVCLFLALIWSLTLIRRGVVGNDFVVLNYGLLLFSILVLIRFVNEDYSFTVRGVAFILLGIGFFVANYYLSKQKKLAHAEE